MITLDDARAMQNDYEPNDVMKQIMGRIPLVPFVGATAIGKNYLMNACKYFIVGTTVTRPPRSDDDPSKYTYVSNDYLLQKIEASEVVQYAVNPTAPTIYCTTVSDYALDQPNARDCFYNAVDGLRTIGYEVIKTVSVLTPAEHWRRQLDARYTSADTDYLLTRLEEAEGSINWSVEQTKLGRADHIVIINSPELLESNVQVIRDFVDGKQHENSSLVDISNIAQGMLDLIRELRQKLENPDDGAA